MAFVEDVSKRTKKSKTLFDSSTNKYRKIITIHDQHYEDEAGNFYDTNESIEDNGDGFSLKVEKIRHAIKIGTEGERRWSPARKRPDEWISIGKPEWWDGADWNTLTLGTPVKSGNKISWDRPQYSLSLAVNWHEIKLEIVVKSEVTNKIRFPVGTNGITRDGLNLISNSTSQIVGKLVKPVAWDFYNSIVPISTEFDNGNLVVEWNSSGKTFPITIDPTLVTQPDATDGEDNRIFSTLPSANDGTGTSLFIGDAHLTASQAYRTLIRFTAISEIPSGATIVTTTLSLYEFSAVYSAAFSISANIHKCLKAWTELQSTWNEYSSGNSWDTAGCSASTDREDTISATVTLDQNPASDFIDWSSAGLTADVQAWVDGGVNNGWMIRSTGEFNGAGSGRAANYFYSSDWTTANQRPMLTVEYEVPATTKPSSSSSVGTSFGSTTPIAVGCSN